MLELAREHHAEQTVLEEDLEERRRRGVLFRELAHEWLVYLEHEKGARPSTLRDYRWVLAEPGAPHRRGRGRSPGLLMAAFGNRPAREITTRQVADYLRASTAPERSPRAVNKQRQVISAIFGYAMRDDTYTLSMNPVAGTSKRREPPPKVLDFYEPEEIEAMARTPRRAHHRVDPSRRSSIASRQAARAGENRQDAEMFRIAAYTGLRLGELRALRWEDVLLDDRRLVVHRAFSDNVEGPTKTWQAGSSRSPMQRHRRSPAWLAARRIRVAKGLRVLLALGPSA